MMIKKLISKFLLIITLLQSSSCATIMFPERANVPITAPGRKIDLDMVALDALGLLFFIVPGVVAFIVDFSTGAIYLLPNDKNTPDVQLPHSSEVPIRGYQRHQSEQGKENYNQDEMLQQYP